MGRGPARAQFEDRVKHYVGGTRNRYNRGTSGHGGDGFPESREYSLEQCPHARSRPEPSDDSAPSASSLPPRTSTSTPSPATSTEESHEGETPTLGDYPKPAAKSTSTPSPATSTYTAPVSDEERKAYTPPKSRPPMDFKVFFSSFPVGLVAWLNLYTGWDMMYSGGLVWVLGLLIFSFGAVLGLGACAAVVGGWYGDLDLIGIYWNAEERLRKGVIVNRILNTYTDVLVRKYAQCSHVDEYGHKRFDDDRWKKEEMKFRDTVWVPEASKFMSEPETKFYIDYQDRLVDIIGAEYERRKTGIIATFREDMNPFDYEHFCAAILNENGWNARATQGSGDQGVDVIAEKDACRVAIQCKLYSSKVGNKAVQEVIAGSIHVDADYRAVVSNRDYTKSAYEIAEKSKVRLLHHNDLQDLDRALGLASV